MKIVTLTVEIDRYNHKIAIDALGAGGFVGSQKMVDECHFELTTENSCAERRHLADVIQLLMAYNVKFTVKYGES